MRRTLELLEFEILKKKTPAKARMQARKQRRKSMMQTRMDPGGVSAAKKRLGAGTKPQMTASPKKAFEKFQQKGREAQR